MGFGDDIKKFELKTDRMMRDFQIEFMQALAEPIIEETPVKTGFLRQSWAYGVNIRPEALSEFNKDSTYPKTATIPGIGDLVLSEITDTIYLSNTAPYIAALEYGTILEDGQVGIQERGWVRGNIARASEIAKEAVKKVKGYNG